MDDARNSIIVLVYKRQELSDLIWNLLALYSDFISCKSFILK
jgi:hypothetical protein